jgi:hypothetical protein
VRNHQLKSFVKLDMLRAERLESPADCVLDARHGKKGDGRRREFDGASGDPAASQLGHSIAGIEVEILPVHLSFLDSSCREASVYLSAPAGKVIDVGFMRLLLMAKSPPAPEPRARRGDLHGSDLVLEMARPTTVRRATSGRSDVAGADKHPYRAYKDRLSGPDSECRVHCRATARDHLPRV